MIVMFRLSKIRKLAAFLVCSALTVNLISFYNGRSSSDGSVNAKTIAEIQEERKQNEEKIAALQQELDVIGNDKAEEQEYQNTLNEKIILIQDNITLLNAELGQLETDIGTAQANIDTLNDDIAAQELEIDANIELFKERLCAMYVTGNDSLALAVLGSTDFYDMLSRVEMVNSIAAHDEELVNTLIEEINTLEASKAALETEKTILVAKQEEVIVKKEEQEASKAELDEAMRLSEYEMTRLALEEEEKKATKEELEEANALLEAQEEEVRAQIEAAKAEAERKAKEEAEKLAQQQQQNNNSSSTPTYVPTTPGASGFAIPTPGFYWVSSYFGPRWNTSHKGIDIAGGGISGSAVVASKAGTVVSVVQGCSHNYPKSGKCCGNGYGKYVVISHDGTYSTLYGHLSSISVSPGQYVSQGQVLGTVGSTGWSTGYHLHFEVWVNGVQQNPLNYVAY
ncbi:MAG: hypothetical protein E7497_07270 [Ruminococcus sp.]|nr:hypothetical protein [Ruminococcus sp.]